MHHKKMDINIMRTQCYTGPTLNIYIARLSLHRKCICTIFGLLIYMVANMAHWSFVGQIKVTQPLFFAVHASELSVLFPGCSPYIITRAVAVRLAVIIIPATSDAIGHKT